MSEKLFLELTIPLYKVKVLVFSKVEDAEARFGSGFLYRNYAAQVRVVNDDESGVDIITLTFLNPDSYSTEILVHECVHVAWRVLDLVRIKVSFANQEPLAYIAGWVAKKVNDYMAERIEKASTT
ncbi:hypothetical protein [Xenorhabdus hominickii]|uniref:Uncharacterized protein n=1 Tax=Xenorhabdus hominickii TaxID=351679 RepID=A0A2G0Q1H0_XENHO|nr:hypothetical protein [Xenorhabdus hominickii]AOM40411.1 hypothetical protein A9255_07355 [Xenorhabdus hominickii]PHM53070.1 hypothetical protein Xhom_03954 [Xenorhabdus hominickii]